MDTFGCDRPEQRNLVVFGASGLIGEVITQELVRRGPGTVTAVGRSREKLGALKQQGAYDAGSRVVPIVQDLAEIHAYESLVGTICSNVGEIHGMVYAAGGWGSSNPGDFLSTSTTDLLQQVQDNLVFPALLVQAVLRKMVGQVRGSVVIISSVAGIIGLENHGLYSGAKAGITGLVRQIAYEFGPLGININAVAPGPVDPGPNARLDPSAVRRIEAMRMRTPSGALATPREVSTLAVYLLSRDAKHINGQTIAVDGGMTVS